MFTPREPLTKENILSKITSYDIFKFYCEGFLKLDTFFRSEFRKDKNPSCRIGYVKGDLLYCDFGEGSYRCFDYVMKKFSLSYGEALNKINIDFNLGLGGILTTNLVKGKSTPVTHNKVLYQEKKPTIIKIKSREFTKKDLEYWNSFYWTEEMLKLSNTKSISHYWINDEFFKVPKEELAFSYDYYWHQNRFQRKLYFPERKEYKWFSNVDNSICQLSDVAPKTGDVLFITSSKKDAGLFWRINIDKLIPDLVIHGVAPNNELTFVPKEWFYKMQNRWKRIIIAYDNDTAGIKNAKKFSKMYNIEWITTPDNTEKDVSDYAKRYGLQEFSTLIKSKL